MTRSFFLLCVLALCLTGCADQISFTEAAVRPAVGFWYGLWHGMALPFAWFGALFDESIAIYAIYNNGGWYDFGFALGAGAVFGGGSKTSQ